MISTNKDNNGKIYKIDVTDDTTCEIYRKGKLVYSDRYGSIIDAQKLYNKVMSAQENEREIVMLFGRTACEILEALDFYEKGKTVMTREEAFNKIRGYFHIGKQNDFLLAIEALGLIKFDDPEPLKIKITTSNGLSWSTFTIDQIAKALEEYDFEIVPKGTKS